jgi:hypothetical protein
MQYLQHLQGICSGHRSGGVSRKRVLARAQHSLTHMHFKRIPHHTTPHHTTPPYPTPHHTTPHHTTPHHTTPHHTTRTAPLLLSIKCTVPASAAANSPVGPQASRSYTSPEGSGNGTDSSCLGSSYTHRCTAGHCKGVGGGKEQQGGREAGRGTGVKAGGVCRASHGMLLLLLLLLVLVAGDV